MTTFLYVTIVLFSIVSLFMILLILIQKGRGGGLASAFGGAGGNTAFGSKTGDVLTWATSIVFGIFLVLAVVMNLVANQVNAQRTAVPTGTNSSGTNSSGTNTSQSTLAAGATPSPLTGLPTTNPTTQP